jgi:hypothetical protein
MPGSILANKYVFVMNAGSAVMDNIFSRRIDLGKERLV